MKTNREPTVSGTVIPGDSGHRPHGVLWAWFPCLAALLWTGVSLSAAVVTLTPEVPTLKISGRETEVTVNAAGIPDWQADVPKGQTVTFRFDPARVLIDIATPGGNQAAIALRLPDGARAGLGAASSARFDWFKDKTYYLAGRGSVTATNADGQKFVLSPLQPPMTGGPMVVTTDAKGGTHTTQLSPITPVKISGQLGDELIVQVGPQQVKVPVDGPRTVTLPNGSEVTLTQSSDTRTLSWVVAKGYFQFKVDGTGRWQADGLTDQSAAMQWSTREQTGSPGQIDIKNLSSDGPLLLVLPGRTFASVSTQATLQFAQGDGPQYSVTVAGGEVTLYNTRTGTETTLHPSDRSLRAGGLDSGVSGLSRQPITVLGDDRTLIRVRGEYATVSLLDKSERVLFGQNGSELTVKQPVRGTLVLEATTGNHVITFLALAGWNIDLPEGQKLTWVMEIRRGIITATTSGDNTTLVRIVTADGFTPVLPPGTSVTFILNQDASLQSATGFGKLPEVNLTGTIQQPIIIEQPPVSVIR